MTPENVAGSRAVRTGPTPENAAILEQYGRRPVRREVSAIRWLVGDATRLWSAAGPGNLALAGPTLRLLHPTAG